MTNEEEKVQLFSAIFLIILLILGYCLYSWIFVGDDNSKTNEITPAQQLAWIEKSKLSVRERLKDPDSAQFKGVFFHHNYAYAPVACGEVNSKNSFGGYSGFQRFVSSGEPALTFLENDMKNAEEFRKTWASLCFGQEKATN